MASARSEGRVVVIGSGPVGGAAARRLVERGCATLLLDAGDAVALPDVPGAPPGSHLRNQPRHRREPDGFLADALGLCDFYDAAAPPEGLPGACETIAFGGQGLLWTNNCPRTQAGLDRWPGIDDGRWDALYADAESVLDVRTTAFPPSERGRRIAARLGAHLAARGGGRSVVPLPLAARPTPDGGVHYTATADVLAPVAADPRLEVRRGVRALALELDAAGRASAVRVVARGDGASVAGRAAVGVPPAAERIAADAFVVAAGAFASPRLLHASGVRVPALGRWLHYHPLRLAQVLLDDDLAAPSGSEDAPPRLWIPPTRDAPWHAMVLRDVAPGVPAEPAEERRLVELQFFAPVEPRRESAMTLDGERPRFAVRLSERDRAVLAAMQADFDAIGRALGRWRRGCEPSWNPWGFSHPMGTTRLGDDPATSVADATGRVHRTANVYVAGPGVIPNPIAVNPTLTAVALALATADAIARGHGPRTAG